MSFMRKAKLPTSLTFEPCQTLGCDQPAFSTTDDGRLLCEDCLYEWATEQAQPRGEAIALAGILKMKGDGGHHAPG
jgi:hypothetical protein